MDAKRFDALTRTLATRPSRRLILRGLGGGVASGMLGLFGGRAALAADCADRCARLPTGADRDQCLAACARVEDARAQAEDARAEAELAREAARGGRDVGDFPCEDHHIYCYVGKTGVACQQVGELQREKGFCPTLEGCMPCGGWPHFDNECNTTVAACDGECYAQRNDSCSCLPQGSSCTSDLACCSDTCIFATEVGVGVCG